ncbi:hypothetical protein CkaCkLH20_03009 [Colletotrichum karsti]|uniref:BTB domain-containing protein n=1 Tax=Colletotrichum karsti TaxID=1095194 RepID=A0A9P6LNQ5_9PEZI|nr:uncharacterized protein CkaCkLH20_03009 [Colletotrichum karsti]KAF9879466.1 hypothetical protein CkaCkLH20_03009 [Colletotrichum karsti]
MDRRTQGSESPDLNGDADSAAEPGRTLGRIRELTRRVRSALREAGADAAFKEYGRVADHAALCRSLLRTSPESGGGASGHEVEEEEEEEGFEIDPRSSLSGRSLHSAAAEADARPDERRHSDDDGEKRECLAAIRDWKACVEALLQALRGSLAETYRSYEPGATPEMVEALFGDVDFRASAIQQMRNARIGGTFSGGGEGFSRAKYDVRFRNHDRVKKDLVEVVRALQMAEAGESGEAAVEEVEISARGDAVLEFADERGRPALRFRVSSWMLAETSPVFERMFTGRASIEVWDDEDLEASLPAEGPPGTYTCRDGSEARLYRMPQAERDAEGSLTTLLHAAHMHNERVPREVSFEGFVAMAETCLRYRCTSPLEVFVEHRWLPLWIHKGSEEMPDGMLVVSYVFGFRQLFARMSKTAVLNVRGEEEVRGKRWPRRVKERVWGLREAKMGQVEDACAAALREYLVRDEGASGGRGGCEEGAEGEAGMFMGRPRCPKGSHWCDATNLGWLMMTFGELGLLSTVMKGSALGDSQQTPPTRKGRSLAELVDQLRTIESPPQAVHKGAACDPAARFRAAVSDIYNSVSGLTLFEVSGRAHGWGLSRHRSGQVQAVLPRVLRGIWERTEVKEEGEESRRNGNGSGNGTLGVTDEVRLMILRATRSVEDLRATAVVDKGFWGVYKENEGSLTRRFVKAHRRHTLMKLTSMDVVEKREEKVTKTEGDVLKMEVEVEVEAGAAMVVDGVREDPRPSSAPGYEVAHVSNALSEEEVERILWPDSLPPPEALQSGDDMKEKFRRSDPAFTEGKMLLRVEDKQLREQRDIRVGLVRDGG